jgi:hypothetical protein
MDRQYMKFIAPKFFAFALVWVPTFPLAASRSEVMASRYMKYSFCMQKALGQLWWKKAGVTMGMNQWGVSEPTRAAISSAPAQIVANDGICRKANEIEAEPRPEAEWPVQSKPN